MDRLSRSGGDDVRTVIYRGMVAEMSGMVERGTLLVMCIVVAVTLLCWIL
ncbi:hypothetical protein [Rhizobium mongolense]|nr:hypothetical protein [Rhizobium mongolense]